MEQENNAAVDIIKKAKYLLDRAFMLNHEDIGFDFDVVELQEKIENYLNGIDNGWISVEEALPENSDEVLCYAPYIKDIIGHVLIGKYFHRERGHSESWTVYDFEEARMDIKVTHWQKLPQPPNKK